MDAVSLYLSLQLGLGHLGGSGTAHPEIDVNPKGLSSMAVQTGATGRIALGVQKDDLGIELGYARLGKSYRTAAYTDYHDDTIGEIVQATAVDIRAFYEHPLSTSFRGRIFGSVARISYRSDVWMGHALINGKVVAPWQYPGVPESVAWEQWKHSTGATYGAGGGLGLDYAISKHVDLTSEVSFLSGEFNYQAIMFGVRLRR